MELDAFNRKQEAITSKRRAKQIALIKKKAKGAFSAFKRIRL